MRLSGVVTSVAGVAGGAVVAVTAYHATATPPHQPVAAGYRAPAVVGRALPAPPPRIVVHTEPCHRPAHLVKGACVTRVVRTVVVHDLPPAAPAPPAAPVVAPAPPRTAASPSGEREREDRHEKEAQEPPEPGDDH